jgi:ubiquinone/menaquinone biosynthesis C-methylase UbiE
MVLSEHGEVDKVNSNILDYYALGREAGRLSDEWNLERVRSQSLILRSIPAPPARVVDIGAGPGLYSVWLAGLGYSVHVVDLIPMHVDQAREAARAAGVAFASECVADARALPLAGEWCDAALMMGPLYHLTNAADRRRALTEALRVLRHSGILIAVGISRFAALLEGFFSGSIAEPEFREVVDRGLATGCHVNTTGRPEHFTTAYLHRPDELGEEVSAAGFRITKVVAIEGFGTYLPGLREHWRDTTYRTYLLGALEQTESEPSMIGISSHVMVVAAKP